jgi:ATP-dependent Clp protease protease subunit
VLELKRRLNEIMAKHTGQTVKQIGKDLERDNFMGGEDAVKYGLIDALLASRTEMPAIKKDESK